MLYAETLDFLYAQLPMYQRIGAPAFKKDLTNILALCESLGNPQHRLRCIHVGGTNGKGSVSHMLAAVCSAAGLKTGLYTSPHYRDFRERIKIDGRPISRSAVVEFVARNREAIDRIRPSFFELTVAMAFDYFERRKTDIAIIEVGLGGRLDSTNVITPLLSVITNISFDHMDMLGDTLDKIAFEKAGIIKPGIPVVIGETHPETAPVFHRKAVEVQAPITFADQRFRTREITEIPGGGTEYAVFENEVQTADLRLDAGGPYQQKNLATLLEACRILETRPEWPLIFEKKRQTPPALRSSLDQGLAHLRRLSGFMGRWQWIGDRPRVLCDSAHNEGGLRLAFERIRQLPWRRLHIVTGTVRDKDLSKSLPLYPTDATYYFAKADIPRGLEAETLRDAAQNYGLHGRAYRSVRAALKAARRAADPEHDLILVIGSIFVVAEVVPYPSAAKASNRKKPA